jgi:outer membrane protein
MEKIQKGFTEMKKYEAAQNKIIKKYEDQMKKLETDYKKLGQDFQSQRLLLTQDKQNERLREIQQKEQEIARFQREKLLQGSGEMYRKINEAQKPYLDKIIDAIKKVSNEKGLDLMLNNAQGLVLFTSDKIDYSKDVIDLLNKK